MEMDGAGLRIELGCFLWLHYKYGFLSELLYKGAEICSEEGAKHPSEEGGNGVSRSQRAEPDAKILYY